MDIMWDVNKTKPGEIFMAHVVKADVRECSTWRRNVLAYPVRVYCMGCRIDPVGHVLPYSSGH